jgi:asparagine synthase (glutamine-hydrolysing)
MCGIAGILSSGTDLTKEEILIANISESLRMRGPDEQGEFTLPYISLIHPRRA